MIISASHPDTAAQCALTDVTLETTTRIGPGCGYMSPHHSSNRAGPAIGGGGGGHSRGGGENDRRAVKRAAHSIQDEALGPGFSSTSPQVRMEGGKPAESSIRPPALKNTGRRATTGGPSGGSGTQPVPVCARDGGRPSRGTFLQNICTGRGSEPVPKRFTEGRGEGKGWLSGNHPQVIELGLDSAPAGPVPVYAALSKCSLGPNTQPVHPLPAHSSTALLRGALEEVRGQ